MTMALVYLVLFVLVWSECCCMKYSLASFVVTTTTSSQPSLNHQHRFPVLNCVETNEQKSEDKSSSTRLYNNYHKDDTDTDTDTIGYDNNDNNNFHTINGRRQMFGDVLRSTMTAAAGGCCASGMCAGGTSWYAPPHADALAQITTPPADVLATYDVKRNQFQDASFACGMATGMRDYEKAAFPKKKQLFETLFTSLSPKEEPVIVEVGMGSFPNALYYKKYANNQQFKSWDIIGIDPNDQMELYAKDNAQRANIESNVRIVHGVSEALPLETNSCDAVICTLTMCSVLNPQQSVQEIKRILKPGGKFLFWEHVLSETDPYLAREQIQRTPQQMARADGCHLNRRTGETIKAAGFQQLDIQYFELQNFGFLNPTVCGIATA